MPPNDLDPMFDPIDDNDRPRDVVYGPVAQRAEDREQRRLLNDGKLRKEMALARKYELENHITSKQYLDREAFKEASATLLAQLAQALRSLPDTLERQFHLSADMLEEVERVIDHELNEMGNTLEMFVGEEIEWTHKTTT